MCKLRTNISSAYWAPEGCIESKLRDTKYGGLKGARGFRLQEMDPTEEEQAALDDAMPDGPHPASKKVEVQVNEEQWRRSILFAVRNQIWGNERPAKGERAAYAPYDVNALARLILNGDAVPANEVRNIA